MDKEKHINEIYGYLKSIGRIHTQNDFAEAINSNKGSVSSMLSGKEGYLTDNLFLRIYVAFDDVFNKEWLLTGEGEMAKTNNLSDVENSTVIGNNVNGGGDIHISNNERNEAFAILQKQLEEKDKEIERLHSIIDKLLSSLKQ